MEGDSGLWQWPTGFEMSKYQTKRQNVFTSHDHSDLA